jgi:hypothetical protein
MRDRAKDAIVVVQVRAILLDSDGQPQGIGWEPIETSSMRNQIDQSEENLS